MANEDSSLKFHLACNQLSDAIVPDESGNGNVGTVTGSPELVRDPYFGSVLRLDGTTQFVTVKSNPDLQIVGDQTLEIWIRPKSLDGRRNPLYKSYGAEGAITFEATGVASYYYGTAGKDAQPYQGLTSKTPMVAGEWAHLAMVRDTKALTLTWYLNGDQDGQVTATYAAAVASPGDWLVGKGYAGFFAGDIAHARIYDRVLTQDEIRRDINEDQTALAAFRSTHPISFCLCDQNEQNVLYILDESRKSSYHFEATNDSRRQVTFPKLDGADQQATSENSVFQITFRPGVLEDKSLAKIAASQALWKVGYEKGADGSVVLYFSYAQDLVIEPGKKAEITLQNVEIAAGPGSRGTRVEFVYQGLQFGNEPSPVGGRRVQHVSIINERGRKEIPLYIGFSGSSSIVNANATANDLTLRLENALTLDPAYPDRSVIRFNPANHEAPSKFIISFDTQGAGQTRDWAIATVDQARAFQVFYPSGTQVPVTGAQGESPEWVFSVNVPQLDAGKFLDVSVKNIVSSLPNGATKLYLRYENIPGYRDGILEAAIEKSPLFFANSQVCVGSNAPGGALSIRGQTQYDELIYFYNNAGKLKYHINMLSGGLNFVESRVADYRLFLQDGGNVGIGTNQPGAKLHVNGSLRSTTLTVDGALTPSAGNAATQGIMFPQNPGGGAGDAAWIRYYPRSGESMTLEMGVSNDADDHIAFMPSGNVGIGTNAPTQKLDVRGRVLAQSLQIGSIAIGENELRVLQRLAAGQLEFDLYNTKQGEYMYAADYAPYDNDRRRVFTWRPKNRINQGRWRLSYPA